jgi:hypothetical protein
LVQASKDAVGRVQAFVGVFLLQEWGSKEKVTFSWGVSAVGTDPKKKSGSKLLLNRTNGIQYFYWCFNFLMNLIASLSWVFKFVFKSGGDNLSSTGLVKTAEASSW